MRMMYDLNSILEKIKDLRVKKDLSQTQMAKFLGITQAGYANIENNDKAKLSLTYAVGIAEKLNVGFNELYGIPGDNNLAIELRKENESLKKRIEELEDLLKAQKQILDLIDSEDIQIAIANSIRRRAREKKGYPNPFEDQSDEALSRGMEESEEFKKNARKFVQDHINKPGEVK
jgi:transcriptional regulator with XRE-family HTH domain